MQVIKQWIICIMVSSIIGAVVNIFTPDSSVGRTMKTVVASFLLCAFLSPFIGSEKIDFSKDFPGFSLYYSSLSEDISSRMSDETKNAVEIQVISLLNERGIEYDSIDVDVAYDDNKSLCVNSIIITADAKYSGYENEIVNEIKYVFSVETECKWIKK